MDAEEPAGLLAWENWQAEAEAEALTALRATALLRTGDGDGDGDSDLVSDLVSEKWSVRSRGVGESTKRRGKSALLGYIVQ